jgi:hypothetical protein
MDVVEIEKEVYKLAGTHFDGEELLFVGVWSRSPSSSKTQAQISVSWRIPNLRMPS